MHAFPSNTKEEALGGFGGALTCITMRFWSIWVVTEPNIGANSARATPWVIRAIRGDQGRSVGRRSTFAAWTTIEKGHRCYCKRAAPPEVIRATLLDGGPHLPHGLRLKRVYPTRVIERRPTHVYTTHVYGPVAVWLRMCGWGPYAREAPLGGMPPSRHGCWHSGVLTAVFSTRLGLSRRATHRTGSARPRGGGCGEGCPACSTPPAEGSPRWSGPFDARGGVALYHSPR